MSKKIFDQPWWLQAIAGFAAWGFTDLLLDYDHGMVTLVLLVSLSIYIIILSLFFLIQKLRKKDNQPI